MYNLEYAAVVEKQRRLDERSLAEADHLALQVAGAFNRRTRTPNLLAGLGAWMVTLGTVLQDRYGSLQQSDGAPCPDASPLPYP